MLLLLLLLFLDAAAPRPVVRPPSRQLQGWGGGPGAEKPGPEWWLGQLGPGTEGGQPRMEGQGHRTSCEGLL